MEQELCSHCACVSAPGMDEDALKRAGWDLTGEFGSRCPGCAGNAEPGPSDGLDGVVEALGATKKESDEG